jgi:adenylate cyclase
MLFSVKQVSGVESVKIFSMLLKQRYFAGIVLALSLCLSVLSQPSLELLGWTFHDSLQRKFPETRSSDIVLVNVDNASLKALAEQGIYFPFPREIWAEFLKVAETHGATAVGIDVILSEESIRGPADDDALGAALASSPVPVIFPGSSDNSIPPPLTKFLGPRVELGNISHGPSGDGIYRHQPSSDSAGMKSFPVALASLSKQSEVAVTRNLIHYTPNIVQVPLFNVLLERTREAPSAEMLSLLKNKIWLLGYSAAGLLDLKSSPLNNRSPGTWIIANALNNLLLEDSGISTLTERNSLLLFVSVLALALLSLVYSPFLSPVGLATQSLLLTLCLPALVCLTLWKFQFWFNPLPLFLGLATMSVLVMLQRIFVEWRERLQFTKVVEHSMSVEMLSLIKEGKLNVDRFGDRKPVTILFADLAGFTTLSERLKPEELVEVINAYLDDVVDLIFKNKGYIDKFIGDAVMALWGAPVDDPKQYDNALSAAIDFEEMTKNFQKKIKAQFKFDFEVNLITRVGLHAGEAIVGNLGARKRFNYTALGDAVNLASRLEGMGKQYHQLLTISGDLVDKLSDSNRADLLQVDEVVVKGKSIPTKIFTYCSEADLRSRYTQGFAHYQKGLFQEALRVLSASSSFGPEEVLRARCEMLLSTQGNKSFKNGVWHHDEK